MFTGFTQETSDFLWALAFNNERPWFNAHKELFHDALMSPFKALAEDTFAAMESKWPDAGFQLHVSRIYRDARRLYGRGPYKDHLWFSVKNWDGLLCGPMFWFEIGAADYAYGMGFYSASAAQMRDYRAAIDANPAAMERLVGRLKQRKEFALSGEEYKRPQADRGPELNPWYNRKTVGLECRRDFGGALLDESLPSVLVEAYDFLMPFYDFFMRVCRPEE